MPIVEAFLKSPHLPVEGPILEISQELQRLIPDYIQNVLQGRQPPEDWRTRPPVEGIETQIFVHVRQVLWDWTDRFPSLRYVGFDKTSLTYRLIRRCLDGLDEVVAKSIGAIYAGIDFSFPPTTGDAEIVPPTKRKKGPQRKRFPQRAQWLKQRLKERWWNKHDVQRMGGPSRQTVQNILNGFSVREDCLERLAATLSKKLKKGDREIRPEDIPND